MQPPMAHSFNIDSHHLFASPAAFTTLKSQSVVDTVVDTLSTLGAFRCSVLDEAEGCKLEYDSLKAADYYVFIFLNMCFVTGMKRLCQRLTSYELVADCYNPKKKVDCKSLMVLL